MLKVDQIINVDFKKRLIRLGPLKMGSIPKSSRFTDPGCSMFGLQTGL